MKVFFCRLISHLLVISVIALPFSTQAALVGTDEVVKQAQMQSERDKVRDFVARADVQKELQSYGLTPQTAKERVDALTDMEVQQIAGKIDALPAGAINTAETVLLIAVLVVVLYVVLKYLYR